MKRRAQAIAIAVCFVSLISVESLAQPLLIDDFEYGAIADPRFPAGTIEDDTADNAWILTGQPDLPTTNAIFSHRYLGANLTTGSRAGVFLSPNAEDSVDDGVRFRVDSNSSASFLIAYDGGTVDLARDGGDRLSIEFVGDSPFGMLEFGVGAFIDGDWRVVEPLEVLLTGGSNVELPFSALMPRDPLYPALQILRHADGMEFRFEGITAGSSSFEFAVSSIRAVPEPGVLLPIAAGGLVIKRRSRRAA